MLRKSKKDHVTGLVLNDSLWPSTMIQGKVVEGKRKTIWSFSNFPVTATG